MDMDTEYFSVMVPPGKTWFTPPEVAPLIGRTPQYVRNAINAGVIAGHVTPGNAGGRQCHSVHRDALLLHLRQTASYEPLDILDQLAGIIRKLPARHRRELDRLLLAKTG